MLALPEADGLRAVAQQRGLDMAGATVAVVGATGSIGRAVAILLAEEAGRLLSISCGMCVSSRRGTGSRSTGEPALASRQAGFTLRARRRRQEAAERRERLRRVL
jgi:hypothetical protein